ncbi:small integral membrane protein 15 isoform X1 [Cavia porcellus]|uniref:small integral membrane protein 15 isoform X1 n=1 Tax=Cavia porcellus TaxID=10141 RepID=UPI002FE41C1E
MRWGGNQGELARMLRSPSATLTLTSGGTLWGHYPAQSPPDLRRRPASASGAGGAAPLTPGEDGAPSSFSRPSPLATPQSAKEARAADSSPEPAQPPAPRGHLPLPGSLCAARPTALFPRGRGAGTHPAAAQPETGPATSSRRGRSWPACRRGERTATSGFLLPAWRI